MKQFLSMQWRAKFQPLFLRFSLLFVLFAHGRAKITAGPERRAGLWQAMGMYGINFFPEFWWFMAAYAESIAVIFIVLWLLTRFHAFLLAFTLLTAMVTKIFGDGGIERLSELSAAFYIFATAFAVMMSGAGPVANLDALLFGNILNETPEAQEKKAN